jgi:hypothetical protein
MNTLPVNEEKTGDDIRRKFPKTFNVLSKERDAIKTEDVASVVNEPRQIVSENLANKAAKAATQTKNMMKGWYNSAIEKASVKASEIANNNAMFPAKTSNSKYSKYKIKYVKYKTKYLNYKYQISLSEN